MKILGFEVPPEYADLFAQYVTSLSPDALGKIIARQRKGSKKVKIWKPKKTPTDYTNWVANKVADIKQLPTGSNERATFLVEEVSRLRAGVFDPAHWIECEIISDDFHLSIPSCSLNTNPKPYAYRAPDMLPSTTLYYDGIPSTGPTRSSGELVGTMWQDLDWVWRRILFKVPGDPAPDNLPPLMLKIDGEITINASDRASRPMLSFLFRGHLFDLTSTALDDYSAPIKPARSLYWRFKIPPTTPPYFHATIAQSKSELLNPLITPEPVAAINRALIKFGVRPMFGHGFNNNTTVATSFSGTVKLLTPGTLPSGGLCVSVYFFQTDGTLLANPNSIGIDEIFIDMQTSLRGHNTGDGYAVFQLRTNYYDTAELTPSFQPMPLGSNPYQLFFITAAPGGWYVCIGFDGSTSRDLYFVAPSGASSFIGSEPPANLYLIDNSSGGSGAIYDPTSGNFAVNYYHLVNLSAVGMHDCLGNFLDGYIYEDDNISPIYDICSTPTGIWVLARYTDERGELLRIYEHNSTAPVLLFEFLNIVLGSITTTFYDGYLYIFPWHTSLPYYKIGASGVLLEVFRDPRVNLFYYNKPRPYWAFPS